MASNLVYAAVLGSVFDWQGDHSLNPRWITGVRFHKGLLLFLLLGVFATGPLAVVAKVH
jgi:hypothetical protein